MLQSIHIVDRHHFLKQKIFLWVHYQITLKPPISQNLKHISRHRPPSLTLFYTNLKFLHSSSSRVNLIVHNDFQRNLRVTGTNASHSKFDVGRRFFVLLSYNNNSAFFYFAIILPIFIIFSFQITLWSLYSCIANSAKMSSANIHYLARDGKEKELAEEIRKQPHRVDERDSVS